MSRVTLFRSPMAVTRTATRIPQRASTLAAWIGGTASRPTQLVDGIFEGGGALGAAYPGTLRALEDEGLWFARVAGTSAGAILAGLIAAGFTARELTWLLATHNNAGQAPQTLHSIGLRTPVDMSEFLDVPTPATMSRANKRKTLLWHILNGSVLDQIGNITLPVPTQPQCVNAAINAVKSIPVLGAAVLSVGESVLRAALNTALAALPNSPIKIKDITFDTSALRAALADGLWDAVAGAVPLIAVLHNLWMEGGLFDGKVFLTKYEQLLTAKIFGPGRSSTPVRFSDLPIPLAVTGANLGSKKLEVYSSALTPHMSVADAVRRSMCVPFVFDPVKSNGQLIVDGGIGANFPTWLLTPAGDFAWPTASIDHNRPKLGVGIDESASAPNSWNCNAAKYRATGNPPTIDSTKIAIETIMDRWIAQGVITRGTQLETGMNDQLLQAQPAIAILRSFAAFPGKEHERVRCATAMMLPHRYYDVSIPLYGFDWLDFNVSKDVEDLDAMLERAWRATAEAIRKPGTNGQPALISRQVGNNPFS